MCRRMEWFNFSECFVVLHAGKYLRPQFIFVQNNHVCGCLVGCFVWDRMVGDGGGLVRSDSQFILYCVPIKLESAKSPT